MPVNSKDILTSCPTCNRLFNTETYPKLYIKDVKVNEEFPEYGGLWAGNLHFERDKEIIEELDNIYNINEKAYKQTIQELRNTYKTNEEIIKELEKKRLRKEIIRKKSIIKIDDYHYYEREDSGVSTGYCSKKVNIMSCIKKIAESSYIQNYINKIKGLKGKETIFDEIKPPKLCDIIKKVKNDLIDDPREISREVQLFEKIIRHVEPLRL